MQTPVNSSETKAVTSQTFERDPSFLHQLQNNHVGQSFLKQLIIKQDKKKSNYKAVRLSKKKLVFFFKFIFNWEGWVFFFLLPTHTLRDLSEGQKVGQGKV